MDDIISTSSSLMHINNNSSAVALSSSSSSSSSAAALEHILINNSTLNLAVSHADDLYDVPVGILILLSMFYGTISIIAVVGNSLVIWIVSTTRQMQTVTNLFIANLALADVVIGMFAIPFQFQAAILQRWNLPDFMCTFCPYVQFVSVNVSVFTLTAIAVDRHRAIINPLRARPPKYVCKIIITFIWIISLLFSVPIAIALRVIEVEEIRVFEDGREIRYVKPFCDNVGLTSYQMQQYRYYLVFVQYIVPFCVISFVYIQMAIRLWGSKTPGNAQDTRDLTLMRNKKRVIKMLIIVVLLFGICWFPLQLYNILQVTWESINEYRYINIVWFCCDWLAMSNSCYNPFIYGIYNEKFKREFRRQFPFFRLCSDTSAETTANGNGENTTVSMYTRVSSVRSICNTSTPIGTGNSISRNNRIITDPLPMMLLNHHQANIIPQQQQQQQQQHQALLATTVSASNQRQLCYSCSCERSAMLPATSLQSPSAVSSIPSIITNNGKSSPISWKITSNNKSPSSPKSWQRKNSIKFDKKNCNGNGCTAGLNNVTTNNGGYPKIIESNNNSNNKNGILYQPIRISTKNLNKCCNCCRQLQQQQQQQLLNQGHKKNCNTFGGMCTHRSKLTINNHKNKLCNCSFVGGGDFNMLGDGNGGVSGGGGGGNKVLLNCCHDEEHDNDDYGHENDQVEL